MVIISCQDEFSILIIKGKDVNFSCFSLDSSFKIFILI